MLGPHASEAGKAADPLSPVLGGQGNSNLSGIAHGGIVAWQDLSEEIAMSCVAKRLNAEM